MKNCSEKAAVEQLLRGRLSARKRRQVSAHIRDCAKCRSVVNQFARVTDLLSVTHRQRDGTLVIEPPKVTADFVERLKATTISAYTQKQRAALGAEGLLDYIRGRVRDLWAQATEQEQLVGYAATRTQPVQKTGNNDTPRLTRELGDCTARLLQTLLDPTVPLAKRLKWARRLETELRRQQRSPHRKRSDGRRQNKR